MSYIAHNIRATWVPAKINARLAEYNADLHAIVIAPWVATEAGEPPLTVGERLFFLLAATQGAGGDVHRFEQFGRGL